MMPPTKPVRIPVQLPFDWAAVLNYLALRCTPGLETVSDGRYVRRDTVSVEYDAKSAHLLASPHTAETASRAGRLFDAGRDPAAVTALLSGCPLLRPHVAKLPGLRIAGCWEPFELCLRVILGQQVSVKGANTLMRRLVERCPAMNPAEVAQADLSSVGVPGARLRSIRSLAEAAATGRVQFDRPWDELSAQLSALPGFGPWTVEYLAIRLGRDADAFPDTDLGLLRATGIANPKELRRRAERWRPYRAYAAMYLWTCGSELPRD
jgi:DNA-3-methyladenine glycosylase II